MEEADLLRERLQAITNKRRIQENIAKKRRLIEEEKLKLQYMKKALREQWLMDGLSQQSEEEQEALRLQAQDEQHQSDQLQSNIIRIEEEIKALETQELNISANEEVVLKRLKEVEKTSEDIIKKATLMDGQADGKDLNKCCSATENHTSVSVTMETTEQSELAMDLEVEVTAADLAMQGNNFSTDDEQVCSQTNSSNFPGKAEILVKILTELPSTTIEIGRPDCSEIRVCPEMPWPEQNEALILDLVHEELNRNESITSSVSDTLSSADSVYENEAHRKRQEKPEQDPEQEQCPEPEYYPELEQYPEPEQHSEPEQEPEPQPDLESEQHLGPERYPEPEQEPGPEQEPEPQQDSKSEQHFKAEQKPEPQQDTESEQHFKAEKKTEPQQDSESEQHLRPEQYPKPEQEPGPEQEPEPQQDSESEQHLGPEQYPKPEQEPGPEQEPEPQQDSKSEQNHELEQYPEPMQEPGPEQEPEPQQDSKSEQNHELEQYPEPMQEPGPEQESEPQQDSKSEQNHELEQYPEPIQEPGPEQEPEPQQDSELEEHHEPEQEPGPQQYPEPERNPEPEQYPERHDLKLGRYPMSEQDLEQLQYPEVEQYLEEREFYTDPELKDKSILEYGIEEEATSDVYNESCQDFLPVEMDDCLLSGVEISADSETDEADEKWRTIFSSSINKEDDDSYLDSLQLSAQELFVQKIEGAEFEEQNSKRFEEVSYAVPQVEEVLEQPVDIIAFPSTPQEVKYNPLGLQGLSKISEDESENGRDSNHNHTTHQKHINEDLIKKLPKDFCVIQETKSENVSTEHVDFQLARKQWREMEEQTMNKIVLPTAKQLSFHSSHSSMYTPVRNIERTQKKTNGLECLNLVGDYTHTQFSPCSEDSGLDDSSYRSTFDDPETPVEREIRISMEREEHFRRERGLSRMAKSTDCAPSRSMPRSISTPLTPSFIITSSPTKEPLKHEVSANNIIVLNPRNDLTSSPRQGKDNEVAKCGKWCSEDSSPNLIILETSNLIIRSASEFSLNKACEQPQEKIFLKNPFFKLRSRSTMSLVDEEIKIVKQREDELRKDRANLYGKDRFNNERMLSNHMDTLAFDDSGDVPVKCKSSPSSPLKTNYRMDRSALSCDHRFPEVYAGGRHKSSMALRWEAGEFTKHD
ncbi:uncharacterized protein palmdb isoform 2-T2 [Spinachia spinachia]